jgi:hypothetical protein
MIIEIPKGTPEEKIRALLNIQKDEKNNPAINKFFGKLPHLQDGLKIQKRIRSEWK